MRFDVNAVFLFLIFFLWFELKLILLQCNSCSSLCSFVLGTRYDRPTWSNVELALKPNHFELTLGACIGPALANSAPHTGCNPIHPRTLLVFSGKPGYVEPESPVIRYVPYQSDRKWLPQLFSLLQVKEITWEVLAPSGLLYGPWG